MAIRDILSAATLVAATSLSSPAHADTPNSEQLGNLFSAKPFAKEALGGLFSEGFDSIAQGLGTLFEGVKLPEPPQVEAPSGGEQRAAPWLGV